MPTLDLSLTGKSPVNFSAFKDGKLLGAARVATYAAFVAAAVNTYRDARDAKKALKA